MDIRWYWLMYFINIKVCKENAETGFHCQRNSRPEIYKERFRCRAQAKNKPNVGVWTNVAQHTWMRHHRLLTLMISENLALIRFVRTCGYSHLEDLCCGQITLWPTLPYRLSWYISSPSAYADAPHHNNPRTPSNHKSKTPNNAWLASNR